MPHLESRLFVRSCSLALGLATALSVTLLAAQPAAAQISPSRRTELVTAIESVRNSVVNIQGQKTVTSGDDQLGNHDVPRRVNGMGTGVVIDERGYIITNFHVVDGVRKIEVILSNEKKYIAELISSQPQTDLAIIKIDAEEKLPVCKIGKSSDLMLGESVFAIGNAFGYQNTVTRGIISELHRSVKVSDTQVYDDLIQTDASINPGNSGGPLFNIDGEMIGINVAVRAGAQGIGFAIPVDKAMLVAARLMSIERLEHRSHGLVVKPLPGGKPGVLVESVATGSAGEQAGVKPGDIVVAVDSNPVVRQLDLERHLLGRGGAKPLDVTVRRGSQDVPVQLAMKQPTAIDAEGDDEIWEMLGLRLSVVPESQFAKLQTPYRGGLRVDSVRPDSQAAQQGLMPGDVLIGMHKWETISLSNVYYILSQEELMQRPIRFSILRGTAEIHRVGMIKPATGTR